MLFSMGTEHLVRWLARLPEGERRDVVRAADEAAARTTPLPPEPPRVSVTELLLAASGVVNFGPSNAVEDERALYDE